MAKLTIPKAHQDGIKALRKLHDDDVEVLASGLEHAPESVSPAELAEQIHAVAPSLSEAILIKIIEALRAFHSVRARAAVSLPIFVKDLLEALIELEKNRFSSAECERFTMIATRLMEVEKFALYAKAHSLQTSDEKTFCTARVVTDLRPVFAENVEDGPSALVMVHRLQVTYHHGSKQHENFYVSLDGKDLENLKSTLERAIVKADSLKNKFDQLPFYGK